MGNEYGESMPGNRLLPPTLADFVRHERENYRDHPTAVATRLSRTKLAANAGLSAGYIIKIEQGLALKPSDDALRGIAGALNLNDAKRDHLFALARLDKHAPIDTHGTGTVGTITDEEKAYADALNPHLAGYVDTSWNVLYANRAYYDAFPGLEEIENILVWFFKCPNSKIVMVEWEAEAHLTVSWFRSLMAAFPDDKANQAVFDACADSEEFVRMWNDHGVIDNRAHARKVMLDRETNRIYYLQTRLWRPTSQSDTHTFYLATQTDTAA